jgi:hypothetical protein
LERVHGNRRAFARAKLSYLKSNDKVVQLQGSRSYHVKYKNVLCAKCNNERTQAYDQAYDTLMSFVESNRAELLRRRQIDFAQVYGSTWRRSQLDLYKYFVKAFGCRIYDAYSEVPEDFRLTLNDAQTYDRVAVCFAVNEDELARSESEQQALRIGHVIHNETAHGSPYYPRRYATANYYRWLLISYWYGWGPYGPVGEPWFNERQFLCLGSYLAAESKSQVSREDGSLFLWTGFET